MKTAIVLRPATISIALVLGALTVAALRSPPRSATQAFMRQKLVCSEGVLEGIVLEKFELVSRNALRLRNMSQSNAWYTMRSQDYLAQTTNFQNAANALYMAAVDKKLEAATAAYVELARNCVECHRIVRLEQRRKVLEMTQ